MLDIHGRRAFAPATSKLLFRLYQALQRQDPKYRRSVLPYSSSLLCIPPKPQSRCRTKLRLQSGLFRRFRSKGKVHIVTAYKNGGATHFGNLRGIIFNSVEMFGKCLTNVLAETWRRREISSKVFTGILQYSSRQ